VTRAFIVGGAHAPDASTVAGIPVLLRQVLSLQEAGVADIVAIGIPIDRLRSDPRVVANVSARTAAEAGADADAIVVPANTVWHPSIVKRLARTRVDAGTCVVAEPSDAAAAPLYVCGRRSVTRIVSTLAAGGPPPPADSRLSLASGEFVVTTQNDEGRRRATSRLLRSLTKPSDGLASRYLHRPISRVVTAMLLPWPITPNMMTIAAALVGAAGVAVAWSGGYRRIFAGAALFEIQNILDGCDGEIARLKYLRSRGGEWLDQVIDDVLNVAFLAAIGVALARGGARWAPAATAVAVVSHIVHVVGLYAGLLMKAGGRGSVARLRWWVGSGEGGSLVGDLTRRDILAAAYVVAAALDLVAVIFVWHVFLTVGSAAVTTVQWVVWGGPEVQTDGDGAPGGAGTAAA